MFGLERLRDYIRRRTKRVIERWNHPVQRKMEKMGWKWEPNFEVRYKDFAVYVSPDRSRLRVYSYTLDKIICESERGSLYFDRVALSPNKE